MNDRYDQLERETVEEQGVTDWLEDFIDEEEHIGDIHDQDDFVMEPAQQSHELARAVIPPNVQGSKVLSFGDFGYISVYTIEEGGWMEILLKWLYQGLHCMQIEGKT